MLWGCCRLSLGTCELEVVVLVAVFCIYFFPFLLQHGARVCAVNATVTGVMSHGKLEWRLVLCLCPSCSVRDLPISPYWTSALIRLRKTLRRWSFGIYLTTDNQYKLAVISWFVSSTYQYVCVIVYWYLFALQKVCVLTLTLSPREEKYNVNILILPTLGCVLAWLMASRPGNSNCAVAVRKLSV